MPPLCQSRRWFDISSLLNSTCMYFTDLHFFFFLAVSAILTNFFDLARRREQWNSSFSATLNSGILIAYTQGSQTALKYEATAMQIQTVLLEFNCVQNCSIPFPLCRDVLNNWMQLKIKLGAKRTSNSPVIITNVLAVFACRLFSAICWASVIFSRSGKVRLVAL